MILFFVFSTVSKQNKNFFDEKRKKNRPVFFSAHGCFFGKEPLQEYIYIRRRVLIFDFLYTVFSTRWCSIVAIDVAAVLARRRRDDDDAFCPDFRDFRVLGGTVACVPVGDGCDGDCFFPAR